MPGQAFYPQLDFLASTFATAFNRQTLSVDDLFEALHAIRLVGKFPLGNSAQPVQDLHDKSKFAGGERCNDTKLLGIC